MPFAPLTTDDAILIRARDCLDTLREGSFDQRAEMRENLKFSWNDMWSDEAKTARKGKRPMYCFNVIDRLVDSISGEVRQNPLSISLVPVDGRSDKFSAWIKEGVIRGIQYRSESQRAFAWALECAARLSEGYFRLRIDYEHDRSIHPCIKFERIPDVFMAGMDPRANHPTGEDADWCFTFEKFNADEFKDAFGPDAVPLDSEPIDSQLIDKWYEAAGKDAASIKKYLVAEFHWKEKHKKWIGAGEDGYVVDLDEKPQESNGYVWGLYEGEWIPLAGQTIDECAREVDGYKIRGAFVCGHKLLAKPWDWMGMHLPLFRVSGKEVIGDGKRFVKSAISNARDGNRVLNNMVTSAAEMTNANVTGKWVATWKSVKAHWERFWAKSNDPSVNALFYDADPNAPNGGRPDWVSPPVQLQGQFAMVEQAIALQRYTSQGEEATGLKSNATSGRQEIFREQQSAQANAAFPDNLNAAVEAATRDVRRMLRTYYRGSRTIQAVLEEDTANPEPISLPFGRPLDPERDKDVIAQLQKLAEAKQIPLPDVLDALELKDSEEDVRVRMSRSWTTRRMEAQEFVLGVLQYIPPEYLGEMVDLIFENSDAPGSYQIADRLRQAVEERKAARGMSSAADAAIQALTANPFISQALNALTQKTVKAFLEGQGMLPGGEPPSEGRPPQGAEEPMGAHGMPEGIPSIDMLPPEMQQGIIDSMGESPEGA